LHFFIIILFFFLYMCYYFVDLLLVLLAWKPVPEITRNKMRLIPSPLSLGTHFSLMPLRFTSKPLRRASWSECIKQKSRKHNSSALVCADKFYCLYCLEYLLARKAITKNSANTQARFRRCSPQKSPDLIASAINFLSLMRQD